MQQKQGQQWQKRKYAKKNQTNSSSQRAQECQDVGTQ